MKRIWFDERSIPLLFLFVTIAAYGLLLPLTGFYWDDWPFAWIAKFLGPWRIHPGLCKSPSFFGSDLLRDNQPDPACPSLLADLCPGHPLCFRTFRLVCAKASLAPVQTTNIDRCAFIPGVPRLQPALGGFHTH